MFTFGQQNPIPRDNLDNNVPLPPYLAVPSASRPRTQIDPISRFYGEEAPWSSERLRVPNVPFTRMSLGQPNSDFTTWRESPGSDGGSVAPRSDSAYYTGAPRSVSGHDPSPVDQELPSDMTRKVGNIDVSSVISDPAELYRPMALPHDQRSVYSERSNPRSTGGNGKEIRCLECHEVSKCKSDFKSVQVLP